MPRSSRIVVPGHWYHVTQRGNNRQFIFQDSDDFILYLKYIEEYQHKHGVEICAYCLMGNHVHFVVRPQTKDSLAQMFSAVHMRYAQYYQKKTHSSGHVWQGRFYSCLLENVYLKAAVRYVERNPVRAQIVDLAWEYPWSSARAHIGTLYKWIKLFPVSELLDINDWKAYLVDNDEESFMKDLRILTKKGLAFGSTAYVGDLEGILGREIQRRVKGRPRKEKK